MSIREQQKSSTVMGSTTNGKGSARRPKVISDKEFEENWDRIFKEPIDKLTKKE